MEDNGNYKNFLAECEKNRKESQLMEVNKIYNENCLETMKRMPDCFLDLVVTSPPYDNLRDYKGYTFDFESIAKELFRVMKMGGVVVWVVGDQTINGSEISPEYCKIAEERLDKMTKSLF